MGTTPTGRDWCIKALHPSDPMTEVRGIPDESAVPSLFMNYQTVQTIAPSVGATGTWAVDLQLIPHPIGFASGKLTDSLHSGPTALPVEVLNSQIDGVDHFSKYSHFQADFVRWRLAYASVTIYQDGPDLANQGTVVVAQKVVQPRTEPAFGLITPSMPAAILPQAFHMLAEDMPHYDSSQGMPNAYFGRSREGVYVPLKLTHSHQAWQSRVKPVMQCQSNIDQTYANMQFGLVPTASTADHLTGFYPFFSLDDFHVDSRSTPVVAGQATSPFCNDNWADISFRNMAVTTSLSCFFRFGFECSVLPSSQMAPHMKLSPVEDKLATSAYFAIARELKDGFPADFNDLGKIWDVISAALKVASPALAFIPGVGPAIAGATAAISVAGDAIRAAVRKSSEPALGNTTGAAAVQRAREAIARAPKKRVPKISTVFKRVPLAKYAKKNPGITERNLRLMARLENILLV